jgi:hypothetical protein
MVYGLRGQTSVRQKAAFAKISISYAYFMLENTSYSPVAQPVNLKNTRLSLVDGKIEMKKMTAKVTLALVAIAFCSYPAPGFPQSRRSSAVRHGIRTKTPARMLRMPKWILGCRSAEQP